MIRIIYTSILLALSLNVLSAQFYHDSVHLDTSIVDFKLLETYNTEYSAVQLYNLKVLEYYHNDAGETLLYNTVHKKTYVSSDRGVEYFNKMYIPTGRTIDIVSLHARTITRSGKIIDLNENNIKEIENLDGKGAYKTFAIEGVEKGSVVEVLYTLKERITILGSFTIQNEFPVLQSKFVLISPKSLLFDAKGYYANFEEIDTVFEESEKRLLEFSLDSLPALREERYSTRDANLARVEYCFKMNVNNQASAYNTWNKITSNLYDAYYEENKKADKSIAKEVKSLKLNNLSELDKIKRIEQHFKDKYQFKSEPGMPFLSDLEFILKNKIADEDGFAKLLVKAYGAAGVKHELVFTTNRFEEKFDEDFPTYRYLNETLLYFPGINKYTSPNKYSRLGIIAHGCFNNKGLFVIETKLGDFKSAIHEIREIEPNPMEENFTKQIIAAQIFPDHAKIDYEYVLGAYESSYIKPYYDILPEDSKEEMLSEILKIMGDDTDIAEKEVLNFDHNIVDASRPFTVKSKLVVKSLIEQAGNNIIFNIGDVIGEQVEMYDDHKRENPIEIPHKHYYLREISIKIPNGYKPKGLESLIINKEYGDGSKNTMGFISEYELRNDEIFVKVYEYYNSIEYPMMQYEQFREVINAAADFNKISIIFEKQ